jgi:hypothetical protein
MGYGALPRDFGRINFSQSTEVFSPLVRLWAFKPTVVDIRNQRGGFVLPKCGFWVGPRFQACVFSVASFFYPSDGADCKLQ